MKGVFRLVLVLAIVAVGAWLLGFWSPADVMAGRWRSATAPTGSIDAGDVRTRLDQLDQHDIPARRVPRNSRLLSFLEAV